MPGRREQQKSLALFLKDGPIEAYPSARLVLDVLGAVGALHDQGIAHRDISPSNILIESADGQERARLADLGIARKLTDRDLILTDVPHTEPSQPWGTFGYIAPECILGLHKNDYLADIYSVGAVWYKMATGHPPASLREGEPGAWPPLVHKLEDMPAALRRILLGALAPRENRHQNAAAMAAALRAALKPRPSRRLTWILAPALAGLVALQGVQIWASLDMDSSPEEGPIVEALTCDVPVPTPTPVPADEPAPPPAPDEHADETAAPVGQIGRGTVLAGPASRARPRRRSLRSALATCKSSSVTTLEVVLAPGENVEINGGPPFGDLGRCVLREVAKFEPPSIRTALTL